MSKANKSSNSKNYRKKQNRNRSHRSGHNEHKGLAERAADLTISSSGSDSSQSDDDEPSHGSPPNFKIAMWGMLTLRCFNNLNHLIISFL